MYMCRTQSAQNRVQTTLCPITGCHSTYHLACLSPANRLPSYNTADCTQNTTLIDPVIRPCTVVHQLHAALLEQLLDPHTHTHTLAGMLTRKTTEDGSALALIYRAYGLWLPDTKAQNHLCIEVTLEADEHDGAPASTLHYIHLHMSALPDTGGHKNSSYGRKCYISDMPLRRLPK
jgi:hypothetical protein